MIRFLLLLFLLVAAGCEAPVGEHNDTRFTRRQYQPHPRRAVPEAPPLPEPKQYQLTETDPHPALDEPIQRQLDDTLNPKKEEVKDPLPEVGEDRAVNLRFSISPGGETNQVIQP